MRIEEELFAQAIGREIVQYIKNRDLTPKNCAAAAENEALRVLRQIQIILDDDSVDDEACFMRIERIVQAFHAAGISTPRHDWG